MEATITLIKVKPYKQVVSKKKIFGATGDEKTAFRFKTNKNGEITEINELPTILTNPLEE